MIIAVLSDFFGFAFHDPESHQIHGVLHSVADRQFACIDTAILTNILEENSFSV